MLASAGGLQRSLVRKSARVVDDQAIGEGDDGRRTTVALRKLHDVHVVVQPQLRQPLRIRAVPLVDDLIFIPDDEQAGAPARSDQPQQVVLRPVRILEFVDAQMRPTQPHDSRHARLLRKQAPGEVQQAPEIQSVRGDERLAVAREQPGNPWRRLGERRRQCAAIVGVREQAVDQRQEVSAILRYGLAVILQAGCRFIDHRDPIFSLRDQAEVGPQAQVASMLAKQVGGERVERAQARTLRRPAEQSVYTRSHLGGGLRREGQSQDRRVVALLEYPDDPRGQHERLAGARSGQHK